MVSVQYTGEVGNELKDHWKKTIRGSKNLRYKVYRPDFNVLERKFPVITEFIPTCEQKTEGSDTSFDSLNNSDGALDDISFYMVTRGPALLPDFAPVSDENLKMWNDFDEISN